MTQVAEAVRSHRELVAAIDEVLHALNGRQPFTDESVHSARKAIKKARAALRLLRKSVGEGAYSKENAALRDAGRFFSPLRDAKSLVDAFNAFRDRHPAELRQLRYDGLAAHLHATHVDTRRDLSRATARRDACVRSLRACRNRLSKLKPSSRHAAIASGVQRIHRAGRKTLAGMKHEETPEASHEWRKQVKYLANALKILDVSERAHLAKTEERAAKLADRLGDDHDLAELARYVAGDARVALDADAKETLAKLIQRQRAKLHKRAFALGAKIYKEKSGRFAVRLEKDKR